MRHIAALRAAWRDAKTARPFETIAAVVLPDHLHVLWRLPDEDHDFPLRAAHLKAGFTRRLPAHHKTDGRKGERGVWQSRYWEHCIGDDADLIRHINYIHWNPVRHGLVTIPDDWPHSTWAKWKKDDGRPITVPPENWAPLHLGERA